MNKKFVVALGLGFIATLFYLAAAFNILPGTTAMFWGIAFSIASGLVWVFWPRKTTEKQK